MRPFSSRKGQAAISRQARHHEASASRRDGSAVQPSGCTESVSRAVGSLHSCERMSCRGWPSRGAMPRLSLSGSAGPDFAGCAGETRRDRRLVGPDRDPARLAAGADGSRRRAATDRGRRARGCGMAAARLGRGLGEPWAACRRMECVSRHRTRCCFAASTHDRPPGVLNEGACAGRAFRRLAEAEPQEDQIATRR